jgi:hypothetical protein
MFTPERNPFEVLHLAPTASEDEIVRRASQLRRRAGDEAALAELRRAVQSLTGRAEERQLLSLLTHPRPGYAMPALERLAKAFRRPPMSAEAVESCLAFDFVEFAGLIGRQLAEELDVPPAPFEEVASEDGPEEIRRQTEEALWQGLLIDGRA